jgi:hypothetical protein
LAIILRGKNKGKKVKLCQYCNDWVTAELPNKSVKVFKITALEYTDKEIYEITLADTGYMFDFFEVCGNRIKRKRI